METTPFDMRSSLNTKEGLAPLAKAPAESSTQEGQPDGNSLFADMLGQKVSEVTLLGSAPSPSITVKGKKRPLPAALMILSGKGETAAVGKAKPAADHRPRLSTCNSEPFDGIADETDPLAGSMEKISPSLTEKMEPAEETKAAIHSMKEKMEHTMAMPVTDESISQADPLPAENTARQIVPRHSPDTFLFVQTLHPLEAKRLEGATTDALQTAKPVGKESPAPASHETLPLSDRHAAHRSTPEGDGRGTETAFMQRAAETLQRNNGGSAADAPFDLHQPRPAPRDHGIRVGESKEGASITAVPQKTVPAVRHGEPVPEYRTPAGSPDKALSAGDIVTETPGPARDHQQSRNTATSQPVRHLERDMFPFRMEMPNAASLQGTSTPAAVGPAGIEMQVVIDQLLEARQVAGNDLGRIRIMLNPPNLGAVDLDIVVRGERVEVVMTTENATVQQALQSRGDDIRIALQRQDLKIEGFQVLLQDNGTGQQQTDSGAMFRQDREHRERFNAGEDATPTLPVLSPIAEATSAAGRVSIFA
jgi:flagellar hook-length control protein FliK